MKKFTLTIFTMTFLAGMVSNTDLFAVTYTVQVGNYNFSPSSLNVNVGDIVEWVWVAGSHTTTASSVPAGAASWDEPINSGNQTYSYTVTTAGNYNYVCTPHASMGMVGSFTATNPAPYLNVTPSIQNVDESSGITSFSVSSNTSWNASSDKSWCSVTASGSGNGTIVATYENNTATTERTAYITVSATGLSPVVVQVLQDGSSVGIQESAATFLHVFPNPANELLKVTLDNVPEETVRVSLLDLHGKIVFDRRSPSNSDISLDVADLPRGPYFIKISLKNETITRKVILVN